MKASINDTLKSIQPSLTPGETDSTLSHEVRQHIKLLEQRYRAVRGSLEMLTVFEQPNLKSARAMVEDAQALLDAAKQLHAARAAMEGEQ